MSRRETTTEISKTEISVLDAEKRTEIAKAEFELICEDKKRVIGEINKAQKDLTDAKAILIRSNSEIEATNKNLEAVKKSYIEENNSLQKITENRKQAEKDFSEFKKSSDAQRTEIISDISSLDESHSNKKNVLLKELGNLENEKNSVIAMIAEKNDSLANLRKQENDSLKKIDALDVICKNHLDQKNLAESELKKVVEEILQKKNELSIVESSIDGANDVFYEKTEEINKLDVTIATKNEEYKKLESKLFAILSKEDILKQKEIFIKNQYERAGVKWEE